MRLKTVMVGTSTLYDKIVYKLTNWNYAIFLRDSQYSLYVCPTTLRGNVYYSTAFLYRIDTPIARNCRDENYFGFLILLVSISDKDVSKACILL